MNQTNKQTKAMHRIYPEIKGAGGRRPSSSPWWKQYQSEQKSASSTVQERKGKER